MKYLLMNLLIITLLVFSAEYSIPVIPTLIYIFTYFGLAATVAVAYIIEMRGYKFLIESMSQKAKENVRDIVSPLFTVIVSGTTVITLLLTGAPVTAAVLTFAVILRILYINPLKEIIQ